MALADRVTALSARVATTPAQTPGCATCGDDHFVTRGNDDWLVPCPDCRALQWLSWCAGHLPNRLPDDVPTEPLAYRD